MALAASDWVSLRRAIRAMLDKNIPEGGLSSDDKDFERMTGGMNTKNLKARWDKGSIVTSCNSFAGWVAREIGVPATSVLARGYLDISLADKERPGCWQEARSTEACQLNLTPHSGDFYSGWYKDKKGNIQKFGHVGIVYDFDDDAQEWILVQGGQGGPSSGLDYIKWKTAKFDRNSLNGWVDMARYILPNGPYAEQDADADRPTPLYQYPTR